MKCPHPQNFTCNEQWKNRYTLKTKGEKENQGHNQESGVKLYKIKLFSLRKQNIQTDNIQT
jgi:hypothetical protein